MFGWFNKNKKAGMTVKSDGTPQKKETPRNFLKEIESKADDIITIGSKYHELHSIYLTSKWKSNINENISLEVKDYGSTITKNMTLSVNQNGKDIILVTRETGSSDSTFYVHDVVKTPESEKDVLNHLNDFIDQIEARIYGEKKQVINALQVQNNVRIWYEDSKDVLSAYSKYKNNWQPYGGDNNKYSNFAGRFTFIGDVDINTVIAKFPDADLVEIYDTKTDDYVPHDISAAHEAFTF